MLTVNNITKNFGLKKILNAVSFTVNGGDRTMILGANGSGKSTLLKIVAGEEKPDTGTVRFNPTDLKWFYIPQVRSFDESQTIGSIIQPHYFHEIEPELRLEQVSRLLSQDPQNPELIEEFDALLAAMQIHAPDDSAVADALQKLGLAGFSLDTPANQLSGGQKTRLYLAKAVLSGASLLLLDEPTNDLDEEMLEWLEDWFLQFSGGILYVSHDRAFLNRTANHVLELDRDTHSLKAYEGNYDSWTASKAAEQQSELAAWTRQQHSIRQLKDAVSQLESNARFKKGGKGDSGDKFARGFFANRTKGTMKRAVQLEDKLDKLETADKLEKPGQHWKLKMEFSDTPETGEQVLVLDDLTVGYPGNILIDSIDLRLTRGNICVLTGKNGSGKSSLLKTITGAIQPISGRVKLGSNVQIGTMTQGVDSPLFKENAYETLASLISQNETEIRRLLSFYLFFGDDVFVPAANLSNGQRARLTLACFALTGVNLLLLDEPLNHLDIESRQQFEEVIESYPGTVLAVIHDRFFTERCADKIWRIQDRKIVELA